MGLTLSGWLARRIVLATAVAGVLLVVLAVSARLGQLATIPGASALWRAVPAPRLLAYAAVPLVAAALPLAFFAGATAVLADLREAGAWDALRLAGASPRRLLPPILLLGLLCGAVSGALAAWGEPWGRYGLRRALAEAGAALTAPAGGEVDLSLPGLRLLARADGGALRDLLVVDTARGAAITAREGARAEVGEGAGLHLLLREGEWVSWDEAGGRFSLRFRRLHLALAGPRERPSRQTYELYPEELRALVRRNAAEGRRDPGPELAWQKRLAFPAASVVLAFLAVPAGLTGRRGGLGRSIGLALLAGLVWYLVMRWGDGAVAPPPRGLGLAPAVAAWAPVGTLALAAALSWPLVGRAPRRRR